MFPVLITWHILSPFVKLLKLIESVKKKTKTFFPSPLFFPLSVKLLPPLKGHCLDVIAQHTIDNVLFLGGRTETKQEKGCRQGCRTGDRYNGPQFSIPTWD